MAEACLIIGAGALAVGVMFLCVKLATWRVSRDSKRYLKQSRKAKAY
jgi:hypothetical protein